jgi:hypothetical protein
MIKRDYNQVGHFQQFQEPAYQILRSHSSKPRSVNREGIKFIPYTQLPQHPHAHTIKYVVWECLCVTPHCIQHSWFERSQKKKNGFFSARLLFVTDNSDKFFSFCFPTNLRYLFLLFTFPTLCFQDFSVMFSDNPAMAVAFDFIF